MILLDQQLCRLIYDTNPAARCGAPISDVAVRAIAEAVQKWHDDLLARGQARLVARIAELEAERKAHLEEIANWREVIAHDAEELQRLRVKTARLGGEIECWRSNSASDRADLTLLRAGVREAEKRGAVKALRHIAAEQLVMAEKHPDLGLLYRNLGELLESYADDIENGKENPL